METYPISKQLLSEFMNDFYGYGNLSSPYWFIGKEEGGGITIEENYKRIAAWEMSGKTTTVDIIDYHKSLGFTEKQLTSIQPTWTKLIQVLLEIEGSDPISKETRRQYQRYNLGKFDSNNCCLELMPMASRSTGLWLWKQLFVNYFDYKDRKEYFEAVAPLRREKLQHLIDKHRPKVVLFYSSQTNYIEEWSKISRIDDWKWIKVNNYFKYGWGKSKDTLFVITPHPTSHGLTVDDFPQVGAFIRKSL